MTLHKLLLSSLTLFFVPLIPTQANEETALKTCASSLKSKEVSTAVTICKQQLKASYAQDNTEQNVRIMLQLASLYSQQGKKAERGNLLGQIRNSQPFERHSDIQYDWYRAMGADYLHDENFQKAEDYFRTAYNIAQQLSDINKKSRSANDMGLVHFKQKDYKAALLFYKESLELKETIGNQYYIGTTLNNLGLLNRHLKDYSQSIHYYEQALESFLEYTEQEHFDQRVFNNIYHLYEDLAVTYSLAGRSDKGDIYTQKVINTITKKLRNNEKVRALKNLAIIHIEQKDADGAETFIEQAAEYATGNNKYLAEIDYIKASIAHLRHQHDQAKVLLQQATPLAKNNDNNLLLEQIFYLQYTMALADGRLTDAIDAQSQSYRYKELNLKKQYQSDLQVIQEQIKKEQVERQLVTEKLKSQEQKNQIQSLSNTVLIISLILIIVAFSASFVIYRKAKEKQRLVESIQSHKEKVLLLESEHDQETGDASAEREDDNLGFRQLLVELLIETLALWEKTTQSDRIELAEKSGIWKVSIDDGRLRTRSLDKYIDINKIPQHPRWRNVVKTSHYVLAECPLDSDDRNALEKKLEKVMQLVKMRSIKKAPGGIS
ncbi:tetratricopeptide repeat protein [Kangiella shandongensis]|uniref:tetratricopeptide repeat protein n=1 Tax=Kangiella shandongensis TaxID=2763258 RepID=UPI001CBD760D|nr:tetratricopeptide repeat protein [Kangiella shandongensis]